MSRSYQVTVSIDYEIDVTVDNDATYNDVLDAAEAEVMAGELGVLLESRYDPYLELYNLFDEDGQPDDWEG